MLRIVGSVALVLAATLAASARDVEVRSRLERVTVFPDGATVTRIVPFQSVRGEATLVAGDFPVGLDPRSLRVEGKATGGLSVLGVGARALRGEERPAGAVELEKKLEALRLEREGVRGRLEAVQARKAFAERYAREVPFGGKDEPRTSLADWRSSFAAIGEEIEAANRALLDVRETLRKLDRDIAKLEQDLKVRPATRMEVRIDVASDAEAKGELAVTYTVRSARWQSVYDARLDSGAKASLEVVRRAEVIQTSGEDWADVELTVSTVRTASGTQAPETQALLARYRPMPRMMPAATMSKQSDGAGMPGRAMAPAPMAAPPPVAESAAPVQESEAQMEDGSFQAVWRVPGRVSIASSDTGRILRLGSTTMAPDLQVKVAAAVDTTPYLEAGFKHAEDAPLLPGKVLLYRDGLFVGEGRMPAATRDEPVTLGFGADERVKVTRTIVKRLESQGGVVTSTRAERQEMKITVRNGRDVPVKVTVEDRIPYSETQDITVEALPGTPPTTKDVGDKRGVLAWSLDLAAGESRDIRFGWRLRWPADKPIVVGPRG